MGISLNGLTPAGTYPGLIKTGDNTAISGTPKVLSDGNGNDLPMEVSTTGVNFTNQLQQGGVAVPTASQVAAKQDTLVSGTNIKTINGATVLGSGNIAVVTAPSGVSGAIQFSNGSAFASDAANLFWDDTNNRLGVGTNAPSALLNVQNSTNGEVLARFKDNISAATFLDIKADPTLTDYTALYFGSDRRIMSKQGGALFLTLSNSINMVDGLSSKVIFTPTEVQIGTITGARLGVKGNGSTSATTSLLVQNSAGTAALTVKDDSSVLISAGSVFGFGDTLNYAKKSGAIDGVEIAGFSGVGLGAFGGINTFVVRSGSASLGATTANASAIFDITSTTKGFLPPRMTTTQKNAIASPAAGLVLYDSTTNKLQCYNGSTWNDLF